MQPPALVTGLLCGHVSWGAQRVLGASRCVWRQGGRQGGRQGSPLTVRVHVISRHLGRGEALSEGVGAVDALLDGQQLLRGGQRRVGVHDPFHPGTPATVRLSCRTEKVAGHSRLAAQSPTGLTPLAARCPCCNAGPLEVPLWVRPAQCGSDRRRVQTPGAKNYGGHLELPPSDRVVVAAELHAWPSPAFTRWKEWADIMAPACAQPKALPWRTGRSRAGQLNFQHTLDTWHLNGGLAPALGVAALEPRTRSHQ